MNRLIRDGRVAACRSQGFTLMELLVVIGVIAILASIVIVALNPSRQFAQARNTQREADVATILNAIGQNTVDNKGTFNCGEVVIDSTTTTIGTSTGAGFKNLRDCLIPTYIPSALPFDPDGGTPADTKYTIATDALGRFTVCAPEHAEPSIVGSTAYCLTR